MRELTICTGGSRKAATWHTSNISFPALYEKLKNPLRTEETVVEYHAMKKAERDDVKDKGGFMAGTLKGTRRRKEEVVSRSMIALDADKLKADFLDELDITIPCLSNDHVSLNFLSFCAFLNLFMACFIFLQVPCFAAGTFKVHVTPSDIMVHASQISQQRGGEEISG